jgi:hypothetical protein
LAWPGVIAIIAFLFRHQIVAMFKDRVIDEVGVGPVRGKFSSAQPVQEAGLPELPEPHDGAALQPGVNRLQVEIDVHKRMGDALGILNQAYQIQIDFLKHLRGAEGGLKSASASEWFEDQVESRPQFVASFWKSEDLLGWMVARGLITLTTDDIYTIAPMGHLVLRFLDGNFWYAPKTF